MSNLNDSENNTWTSLKAVEENLLGNHRAENFKDLVKEMISAFKEMKVLMSLQIHMFHNHLDFFPPNMGALSDQHGEKFHQEMLQMENRKKRKDLIAMIAEYCWSIKQDDSENSYRKFVTRYFWLG